MLEALRKGVAGWVAKALLGLLIVSFALWGIGDMLRGRTQGALARVGSVDISQDEFRQQYQRQMQQLTRQFRGQLSAEQLRRFGIEDQVLTGLVSSAALDQHAKDLGLAVSKDYIIELTRKQPGFSGLDGKFDRGAFEGALRREGMTEPQFFKVRQQEEARAHLQEAIISGTTVPQVLIDILFRHRDETRTLSYVTIDPAVAIKLPEPTDDQMKQTFEANKRQFVVLESRRVEALVLTVDDLKGGVTVSDTDVEAQYKRDIAKYETVERRKLQQVAFKDEALARAAKAELAKGKSFSDIAKSAGAADSDIELGLVAKSEMIDAKIADAAFALAKDAVSDVVVGTFATVLVRATEIQPGRTKPLTEVAPEIKERLARDAAVALLQKQHEEAEKLRLDIKPLKEIAAAVKGRLIEIAATDRLGNDPAGKPASTDPLLPRLAAAAFEAKIGNEAEAIEVRDGYAWVEAKASTPEKPKTLDQVKDDVRAIWSDQERRRALSSLGAKLVDRVAKGETLESIAKEVGGKVEVAKAIKRIGKQPGLSDAAVQQGFVLARGQTASSESADGKTRIVLRVDEISVPGTPNPAEVVAVRRELGQQVEVESMGAYIDALKQKLVVRIDEQAKRQATRSETSEQ